MKNIILIGLLLVIVIVLTGVTPVQSTNGDIYEESGPEYKAKINLIVEKPGESVCCRPVVSPCVWALHCKCECRSLLF